MSSRVVQGLLIWMVVALTAIGVRREGSVAGAAGPEVLMGKDAPREAQLKRWHEDLDALAEGIQKKHRNAFFHISREDFEKAVAAAHARLDGLQDHEIVVEFMSVAALIGDGHTSVDYSKAQPSFRTYPFWVYRFADGLYITHATAEHRDLIGCRLLAVDGMDAKDVEAAVSKCFPYENESWRLHALRQYCSIPEVLNATGVAKDMESISLRVCDAADQTREVAVQPIARGTRPATIGANDHRIKELPISRQKKGGAYWFEFLADSRSLYCRYDRCSDEGELTVKQYGQSVLRAITDNRAERVIIDLRNNGGGNSSLLWPLIEGLSQRRKTQVRETVYVLIGRATFSSAQLNAAELRREAKAIVIGEPTGQKPNAYGEVRSFTLPHSGLNVSYSTKLFMTDPKDPPSMEPDVRIDMTAKDYFEGRDPVLEAALSHKPV